MPHTPSRLPQSAGLGLRPEHLLEIEKPGSLQAEAWIEVHAENYMVEGGTRLALLEQWAERFPLSLHGVGLSLGSAEGLDREHLARWKTLYQRVRPASVSEHLAWSQFQGTYYADLLPLPLSDEALDVVSRNVDLFQNTIGHQVLIENPALYVALNQDWDEVDFLIELCRRTGCGLLLDINNVAVSAKNLNRSAWDYLDRMPGDLIAEVHLAGYTPDPHEPDTLWIDSHNQPVKDPVWGLYERFLARHGAKPTLIEWDQDLPSFERLKAEVAKAQTYLSAAKHCACARRAREEPVPCT